MSKKNLFIFLFFLAFTAYAQKSPKLASIATEEISFSSPFTFPMFLSGNFAELRSNHFHGGIDIKTQNKINRPIHAIADGTIIRATVSEGGYGNALYVLHNNGFTSVYGHLHAFPKAIAERIEAYQWKHQTFAVDLQFESGKYRIRKGEVMAWSGNTGYSFGPHLHLELRESSTNRLVDPLPFFKKRFKDRKAPVAKRVVFYPEANFGVVNGESQKIVKRIQSRGANCLRDTVEAWGVIGLGIAAYDYMDGVHNKYGVHTLRLFVDGHEVYYHHMDTVAFSENRMINSWVDYDLQRKHLWVMRNYLLPGNTLGMLKTDEQKGLFHINEERLYSVKYELADVFNNKTIYQFVIRGRESIIPIEKPKSGGKYLVWKDTNTVVYPGFKMNLKKKTLYKSEWLYPKIKTRLHGACYVYDLSETPIPLYHYGEVWLRIPDAWIKKADKCYIATVRGNKKYYRGNKMNNGWLYTRVGDITNFTVAMDVHAPCVSAISPQTWRKKNRLLFKLKDKDTGIKSYRGEIDGRFYLFGYSAKTKCLMAKLSKRHLRKGKKHTYRIVVTDYCGNRTVKKGTFTW